MSSSTFGDGHIESGWLQRMAAEGLMSRNVSRARAPMKKTQHLCAGELVEVRSKTEIVGTLDHNGRYEGLPFMPEMFRYCGQRFRVYKRAHKTCDFVGNTGIRKLSHAVHLEGLRCDGSAHGGCQAQCLIFWKDAWLRRVAVQDLSSSLLPSASSGKPAGADTGCSEEQVWRSTRAPGHKLTYVCQATLLPQFTQPLRPWNIWQYIEDYCSGNVASVWEMLPRFLYRAYSNLINLGVGWGPILRWLYDRIQSLRGGVPYPARRGKIPTGSKTPSGATNLKAGELVRVKSYSEILETLDQDCRNRGLSFSAEMAPYCGRTLRVHSRVDRIIDEKTGKLIQMKNPCLILEGAICQARYNKGMIFCPRATCAYWREIWLERVPEEADVCRQP